MVISAGALCSFLKQEKFVHGAGCERSNHIHLLSMFDAFSLDLQAGRKMHCMFSTLLFRQLIRFSDAASKARDDRIPYFRNAIPVREKGPTSSSGRSEL